MLVVRVRLRIKRDSRVLELVALVNSGYEADTPQLMIPISIAEKLGLWPPPSSVREAVFETAGGPLRVWIIRNAAVAQVIAGNTVSKSVKVDIIISPLADEAIISDILAGELEIAIEDVAKGYWRFRWEPLDRIKESEKRTPI